MNPNLSALFDFLRPGLWRKRPAADGARNDATLARLTDTDPVYRALMDHAYALLEESAASLLQPKLSAEDRAYLSGRGNGLLAFISTIEHTRERARANQAAQARRRKEP